MRVNPFKPTAGKMPPILIGREDVIADFAEGIANGAGAPGRLMLLSGQRGFGKTVLLTQLARVAEANGWVAVREVAAGGMCERIVQSLEMAKPYVAKAEINPAISLGGVTASVGKISVGSPSALNIRTAVARCFRTLSPGKGVLVTVDEAQAANRDELVALSTAVQQIIADQDMRDVPDSEKHGIAFVFAGLPSVVDDLVNDEVLTFLRRAMRQDLGPVMVPDVRNAYQQSMQESGLRIEDAEALAAARASGGHPFLVQLIGYYMWQSARRRGSDVVEMRDVKRSIEDAGIAFEDAVCAPTYKGLTSAQKVFLNMMATDYPSSSAVSEVSRRAGKSRSWGLKYRESLIRAHVIEPLGDGRVSFAVPYMGTYVCRASGVGDGL
ncbi:MAG: ATP-binding protein [Coriobacteriales bacterium]|nr:ATP-binding protein [Coriobacteriales bacterium]